MKRSDLLKAFLLITISSIILPACKKDKNNKNSCTVIAEVQYTAASTTTVNNNVTYNNDGTVSYKSEDGRVTTWHYPGSITIMGVAGEIWYKKTITLNEQGMLTNLRTDYDASGTNAEIDEYEYQNSVQLIRKTSTTPHQPPVVYLYTWSNGNLITGTAQSPGQITETFGYSPDKPSAPGDYFTHLNIIFYEGFRVFGSKNLPVSDESSDILHVIGKVLFTYQYDKDGKIKTMTTADGAGQSSKIDYVYQCSGDNYSK